MKLTVIAKEERERAQKLHDVHRYLSSLAKYPTAISPEKREELCSTIFEHLPEVPQWYLDELKK